MRIVQFSYCTTPCRNYKCKLVLSRFTSMLTKNLRNHYVTPWLVPRNNNNNNNTQTCKVPYAKLQRIDDCLFQLMLQWHCNSHGQATVVYDRALIVATWADQFSGCWWRRFLRFLACPLSNNPALSACQSLFIIFAPRRHCCLAAVSKGERGGGTPSQQGLH